MNEWGTLAGGDFGDRLVECAEDVSCGKLTSRGFRWKVYDGLRISCRSLIG